MLTINLPDRTLDVPTSWAEVSLRQALRLAATPAHDEYGLLATLLGCTRLDVMNLPSAGLADVVLPALRWATEAPDLTHLERPAVLHLPLPDGTIEPVAIPATLEMETFGQAVDLGNALRALADDVPALRIRALAIYLYPKWSGQPYDSDALPGFEAVCSDALLGEAVPITDFFLSITSGSGRPTQDASSISPSPPSSELPAPSSSPKRGRRWPSWMRWPRATKPSGKASSDDRGQK